MILARRVDTWDAPYDEWVGCVVLNCAIALTVFCSLRSPRITSVATHFFSIISRTALAAVFCELGKYEVHLEWSMMNIDHLILIIEWCGIFICGEWEPIFIMLCETCMGAVITFTVGQANGATR